jgi:transcriptional regulator with XRE-family HTH domain
MSSPENTRRVSLRDIAKAVGVSVSAVSLALQNSPRVSPGVRRQIHEKILEMGCQPDLMLSALAHYRRSKGRRELLIEGRWMEGGTLPPKT